jgi:probable rRNA maturation factor
MRILITVKQACLPIHRPLIRKLLRRVARAEGWCGDLSVAIVDDAGIAELNAAFRGRPGPTDVLAFPYGESDPDGVAGEIVVSAETAERAAALHDETPERELLRYCVHGLLHLCGYEDRTAAQRRRMEEVQEVFLSGERERGA